MNRKTTSNDHELWYAIKELYRWRKLKHENPRLKTNHVFDKLHRGEDAGTEAQKKAFGLWKTHRREDVFFTLNYFAPEEAPQAE